MNINAIAHRATELRLLRLVLAVIVAPLYLLGFTAALLFVVLKWTVAALAEGFDAGRRAVPLGDRETPG